MYQSFYKLSGKPFRLSPDPSFFFPSRGHKRALAYLRYGLNQDEGFVVITGAPGTGKTTLAKILLQELGDKNLVVAHLTTTQLEADDMLRMVAASFGLRYESLEKAALLKSLEQFLLARARERKRALLVIDEAQNLPERSLEELRMLSNLQVGDKALVQTFLLGQAQFRQMLDHPDLEQLRQRVIANYHLSPLAHDECQRYIESRMHQVDWNDDPHFAEVAYEMIHEYTEGIPRRINMLCDRILLFACMEELHEITGEVVSLVISELENEISGKLVSPSDALQDEDEGELEIIDEAETAPTESKPEQPKKANPESKEASTHAKRVEALSEKIKSNTTQAEADKAKERQTKENTITVEESDSEVMGNTVTKTKPDAHVSDDMPSQAEIDERDLFRVIPGGKTAESTSPAQGGGSTRPLAPAAQAQQPSQEDVVLRRILRLVLAFHRSPSRFPGLDNANQPLPDGITELLELAVSDDQTLSRVSPAAVMGISPMMLRAAVRFFVRRAFFVLEGDDYRVLGLQPGSPQTLIERHYDLLMRLLRQDKQRGSADSVARIGNAYEALSRLDQAVQAKQSIQRLTMAEETDDLDDLEIIEEAGDDLTIDFGDMAQQTERRSSSDTYGKKPYETFDPEVGMAHRRLRYVGQAAVLGFGALVIVLGMYIVQLEPSDSSKSKNKQITITQKFDDSDKAATTTKHLPLSFSDGSRPEDSSGNSQSAKSSSTVASSRSSESTDAALDEILKPSKSRHTSDSEDKPAVVASQQESATRKESKPAHLQVATVKEDLKPKSTPKAEKPKPVKAVAKPSKTESKPKVVAAAKPAATAKSASVATKATKPAAKPMVATVVPQSYAGVDIPPGEPASAKSSTVTATATPAVADNKGTSTATSGNSATGLSMPPAAAAGTMATADQPATVAKAVAPDASSTAKISQGELNNMLSTFETAYQKGDIVKIMGLFAQNARTNSRTTLKGIRSDYMDLFKTSNTRDIAINSVFWEFDNQSARGVGDYRARVKPVGGNGLQTFSGKVTIQVSKVGNKLEMTRFYFSNQSVATASSGATSPSQTTSSSAAISKIEIQNVMTQFIQYYEQGDIDGLMSLFANDAHTNDQTSKAGIRKDYLELFNGTRSRQFTLSKLSWKDGQGGAVSGSGNFVVVVTAKGKNVANTYKGKINIEAKRSKGQILLTKWLHSVK